MIGDILVRAYGYAEQEQKQQYRAEYGLVHIVGNLCIAQQAAEGYACEHDAYYCEHGTGRFGVNGTLCNPFAKVCN